MIALFLLLACSGSDTTTTDQPKHSGGYHVEICVVTHDQSGIHSNPYIVVSQIAGYDVMTESREVQVVHNDGMQADHYCSLVDLYAEHQGQALSTRVAADQNAFKIEKVEVSYWLVPGVDLQTTNVRTNMDGNRGTIEPKNMGDGWWWFNVVGMTTHDDIPTAIIDTSR